MKMEDIRAAHAAGTLVAVRFELAEYGSGRHAGSWGGGDPLVKASVVEAPVSVDKRFGGGAKKGARVRLEEAMRVVRGAGFEELPIGHEFEVESRLIEHVWGTSGIRAGMPDDERAAEREARYREQDAIAAAFERLGMPQVSARHETDGFRLAGAEVVLPRALLARWLCRVDAVSIAADAITAFVEAVKADEPWKGFGDFSADELVEYSDRVLEEIRQGLAVSDAELEATG